MVWLILLAHSSCDHYWCTAICSGSSGARAQVASTGGWWGYVLLQWKYLMLCGWCAMLAPCSLFTESCGSGNQLLVHMCGLPLCRVCIAFVVWCVCVRSEERAETWLPLAFVWPPSW